MHIKYTIINNTFIFPRIFNKLYFIHSIFPEKGVETHFLGKIGGKDKEKKCFSN